MNYALGGAFNSRINLNLREDKGYTYGARSYFSGEKNRGYYVGSSAVKKDKTAESLTEFINELDGYYGAGITEEELAFTKSAIGHHLATIYRPNWTGQTRDQLRVGFCLRMVSPLVKT